MLEKVCDRSYEELLREKLLAPAQLENVALWGETELRDAVQVGQPLHRVSRSLRKRSKP